ncbi:hypothetical protein BU24DRAFT_450103 [Aaosphaeria arxii CBS 175.79]|uniref:Uncharacterized protein n=1 Tax=Aaosphaeria arxii CBS 175.79 TaxID=1450172 RepID=A0A6A5XT03_9PLEO|nr:uncharacterized protein BU24DRAFT_450103 [Aaosphaeria arxii CBS 175.79]KAF2015374.1 hypothetical protein BU24DRAFT_450103 [Aaosphaeria arxii CBS 175.79]
MKAALAILAALPALALAQTTCEPHDDHWHCPSGVPEPTFLPQEAATSVESVVSSALSSIISSAASAASASAQATTSAPEASETHSDHDHEHEHEATATTCQPHGDHWHCPSGVSEPTEAPVTVTATTCQPHGDHWHCPSGVSEPTVAPAQTTGSASSTPSETPGAAAIGGTNAGMMALALGALGAVFV